MQRVPISEHVFDKAFHVPTNIYNAPPGTHADGSRNQIFDGSGFTPWKGLTSLGANTGSRLMRQVGGSYGGLKDYVVGMATIQGRGSFFEDVGRSRWLIGSGQASYEGVDMAGITASTLLQVAIAVNGVYTAGTTYTAGLPQPSAPDIGIPVSIGLGYAGNINGPISVQIARARLATGARSRASTTSAVVSPANQTVRVTYPLASAGQDSWPTFFTQSGFGGVGLAYRLAYQGSLDIPESVVAAGVVDGIARTLEFDYKDGDLIPELAYIDDYVPPAGTHAVRLKNVMCVLGCYGDSTAAVSSTNPGTCAAISLPNFYESFKPRYLNYFPEQIVDVMARPTDEYAYVGHADCVTAMQYVGVRDGPATSVTMVWPDVGIKHPCNWTQVHGLLYVMSATGGPVRMRSDGSVDYDFALPVKKFMAGWTQDNTAVGWQPNSLSVVFFNKTLGIGLSFSLRGEGWSDPCYFGDVSISGGVLSCTNTVGRLIVTVDTGSTHVAYAWNEGATSMPISTFTNWKRTTRAATINELDIGFESDSFTSPLILSLHRNARKKYVRDASTTNASNVIGSATAKFDTSHTGDMAVIFGAGVGGASNYLIGRMTYVSATSFTLSDPITGAALNAQATLTNCYMILASQVFTYGMTRTGEQETGPLTEPMVDEAISHCLGFSLITGATAGQIFAANALGTIAQTPTAITT